MSVGCSFLLAGSLSRRYAAVSASVCPFASLIRQEELGGVFSCSPQMYPSIPANAR